MGLVEVYDAVGVVGDAWKMKRNDVQLNPAAVAGVE